MPATPLTRRAAEVLRRDASGLAAIREYLSALMEEPASPVGGADCAVLVAARRALAGEPATEAEAGSLLGELGRQLGLPKRAIMHALRVALTGRQHGLPVASILYVLGGEETRRRLERAIGALPVARGAS